MSSFGSLAIDFVIIAILILGIWQFRSSRSARTGNFTAAFALLCAMAVVLYDHSLCEPMIVGLALVAGGVVGLLIAMRVNMIQIPAMVAFQHGAGGIAAFLTSFVELTRHRSDFVFVEQWSGILGIVIGAATFSGSMVASAKLAGKVRQTPTIMPRHNAILAVNLVGLAVFGILAGSSAGSLLLYSSLALIGLSILLGVFFAVRIGGADMPVLISFLNATAGLAASFCGIIIENRLLVACGATVAASGSILTHVMCKAMNRNLFKVLVAPNVRTTTLPPQDSSTQANQPQPSFGKECREIVEQTSLDRAVDAATNAKTVIIVPGYGMALAHAQFEVVRIANLLLAKGKKVRFAIHPIAGRMPGHMHVLLAEADADPDMLFDLAEIDSQFQEIDLVLIVGACDVVNPAAMNVEGTPISGMPILSAHEARKVLVCNLDDKPGYSGVDNPLYKNPKTILLLGNAKEKLSQLIEAFN